MKDLVHYSLDAKRCRQQWAELRELLQRNPELSERKDILPFFKARNDLSMLIANYFPKLIAPNRIAHEYNIDGDFAADLVIGDSTAKSYVLVEFEDGCPDSVFKKNGRKSTPDWARRIEQAYSQLTDWLWKLDDGRGSADFHRTFGSKSASFHGLIIIGKDMNLDEREQDRLKWRVDRTMIDSKSISVVPFDQFLKDGDSWLRNFYQE